MNILCGVTGSIAAILIEKMQNVYSDGGKNNVRFVLTNSAMKILDGYDSEKDWYKDISVYTDEDEWRTFSEKRSVLHIDLAKWADCFVVSPCTVNTLSKFATGGADNLLSCCFSAWDFASAHKKCIIALAANTYMYSNKIAKSNVEVVAGLRHACYVRKDVHYVYHNTTVEFVGADKKVLYCGDVGEGAMANVGYIKSDYIDPFTKYLEVCAEVVEVGDAGLS